MWQAVWTLYSMKVVVQRQVCSKYVGWSNLDIVDEYLDLKKERKKNTVNFTRSHDYIFDVT